jgi:PAS domain S-box-containing protein
MGMPDGVAVVNQQGRLVDTNPALDRILGFAPGELTGKALSDLLPRRYVERHQGHVDRFFHDPHTREMGPGRELWCLRADGREIPVLISLTMVSGNHETLAVAVIRDRSDRWRQEQEQQARTAILQAARHAVIISDRDLRVLHWSPSAVALFGLSVEEVVGTPINRLPLPGGGPLVVDPEAVAEERVFRGPRGDGTELWISVSTTPLDDAAGQPVGFVSVARDLTERQQIESALLETEARLAEAEQIARVGTWDWRYPTEVLWWSEEVYRILGLDPTSFQPSYRGFLELIHPDDRDVVVARLRTVTAEQRPYSVEHRIILRDGRERVISHQGTIHRDEQGLPLRLAGTIQDVTDRVRQAQTVRNLDDLLRPIFESELIALVSWSEDRTITHANDAFLHLARCSREDILSDALRMTELFPDPAPPQPGWLATLERERSLPAFETVLQQSDGGRCTVLVAAAGPPGQRAAGTAIMLDQTQRHSMESQVRQAQKMEALGRLAGGIAHDFNNLTTAIRGYAELLIPEAATDLVRADLQEILTAVDRGSALTRQLLAFSRRQVLQTEVVDLNDLVTNLLRMLHRLIGEQILLESELTPQPSLVRVDPGQIEQVIVNLVINARDAIPQGGGIRLATGRRSVATSPPGLAFVIPPGEYATLEVVDTGAGMAPETVARIFDPFFTTKGSAGTGLGMATVYGIVKQSGGFVLVDSQPDQGTRVTVLLPMAPAGEPVSGPARDPGVDIRGGTESILVVEDDPQVRELMHRTLARLGYTIHEAEDADTALALFQTSGRIDLVVSDVVLPGMSGRELAERMRQINQDTVVLFMSGYTEDAILRAGISSASVPFLPKPFTARDLAWAVRRLLDESASDGQASSPTGVTSAAPLPESGTPRRGDDPPVASPVPSPENRGGVGG